MKVTKISTLFWRVLEGLPLFLPAVLAVFSSVVIGLLLTVGLKNNLVWPIGLGLSVIPVLIIWHTLSKQSTNGLRRHRLIDLAVLAGVVLWVVINLFFAAQDAFVTRDPGIYAVTGQWLTTHQKTDIHTPPIIEGQNGLINYSGGIWLTTTPDKTVLQPQGMHLLPALLGMAGRLFGTNAIFKANIFFGGLALLAFYGFARLIMRRGWAALATLTLSVSLPLLYFSRHSYTEIIALTFTFGGLSLLWLAQSQAPTDRRPWLWPLAGFVAGAGALTRPDAYLTVAAIAIYLVVVVALARPAERPLWLQRAGLFLGAAAVPMTIALLDLHRLTNSYYLSTKSDVRIQLALLALVLGGGTIAIALSWRTRVLKWLDKRTKGWRGYLAGLLIMLGLLGLMTRPVLLYSFHHLANNKGLLHGYSVRGQTSLNTSPKLVIDHTMDWISWYIGLPLLILGFVGLAIAASRIMKDRSVKLLPAVMVVGLTTLMYGVLPRITLDQIWAIRRFVPVILPGLVVFGFFALDHLFNSIELAPRLKRTAIGLSAAFIVLLPLSTSRPFLFVHDNGNALQTIQQLCNFFPSNAQVIWLGSVLQLDAVQSSRAFCHTNTLGYTYQGRPGYKQTGRLDTNDLKQIAAQNNAAGRSTILAVRSSWADDLSPSDRHEFRKVLDFTAQQPELSYYHAPQEVISVNDGFELARLDAQGHLQPFIAPDQH